MLKISHRVNTTISLKNQQDFYGVEVDLRQWGDHIVVQHDAFVVGERFSDWVKHLKNQFVILNIKSEGIEAEAVRILLAEKPNIDYFLLDQSFPFMVKSLVKNEFISAVRVSDLEGLQLTLSLNPPWIWVDCHLGDWSFLLELVPILRARQIRSCLASPDLHNRKVDEEYAQINQIMQKLDFQFSAVCTKEINLW